MICKTCNTKEIKDKHVKLKWAEINKKVACYVSKVKHMVGWWQKKNHK